MKKACRWFVAGMVSVETSGSIQKYNFEVLHPNAVTMIVQQLTEHMYLGEGSTFWMKDGTFTLG